MYFIWAHTDSFEQNAVVNITDNNFILVNLRN